MRTLTVSLSPVSVSTCDPQALLVRVLLQALLSLVSYRGSLACYRGLYPPRVRASPRVEFNGPHRALLAWSPNLATTGLSLPLGVAFATRILYELVSMHSRGLDRIATPQSTRTG